MKDLPSKEKYCNKIHTLLVKNSAYPPLFFIDNPPIWITPPLCHERINGEPVQPSFVILVMP